LDKIKQCLKISEKGLIGCQRQLLLTAVKSIMVSAPGCVIISSIKLQQRESVMRRFKMLEW